MYLFSINKSITTFDSTFLSVPIQLLEQCSATSSLSLSLSPSVCLSVSMCTSYSTLFVCLSVCLSFSLNVYLFSNSTLSVCLSLSLNVYLFSVNKCIATFESTFLSVPIQLLEQRSPASKHNVFRTPVLLLHSFQDGRYCFVTYSISLNDTQIWGQLFESF